ncbi:hypothetical protein GCM10028771_11290 [Nocardioides marmoraquaticus]
MLLALAGCGGTTPPAAEDRSPTSSPTAEAAPSPPAIPDEDPLPCAKVRAGIDAFNEGAPELTVRFFRQAVPEAERYAADEPSRTADLLLEAVRYYAELPADDYAGAITGSSEFKRHQVVTLAVCRYGEEGSSPAPDESDDVVPA